MQPRIFRTLDELRAYIRNIEELSASSGKRQFYLEREVAQMKLLQPAGERVPNGILFGSDFVTNFGMAIDFTKTTIVGTLYTTDTTNAFSKAHGVLVNDLIVNEVRGNALRTVKTVPSTEHFTFDAITGQTLGDKVKHFKYGKTIDTQLGTTQTKVIIPAHGLKVGDYVINVTRANAIRKVNTVIDINTIEIDAVSSQSINDNIKTHLFVRDITLSGATTIPVTNAAGFVVGQEITIYDDVKQEDVVVTAIVGNNITVSEVTKSYKAAAGIARSIIDANGSFGKWGVIGLKESRIRFKTDRKYKEIAAFLQHDTDIEVSGLDMKISYVDGSVQVAVTEVV